MKIGFVSLGCSKNLVDTEMMIKYYQEKGMEIVANPVEAEMIGVNTCGFIESAKQEAIDTILEMAEYKKIGVCETLVVTGCLVERYLEELQQELPEVDLFIPIRDYDKVFDKLDYMKREISTTNYAYLKIAEGCSNHCTYCAIPMIRGKYVSRPFEDVIAEAKKLYQDGFREIIVIAQDTTKYGIDLYGKSRLAELLQELAKMNFTWIRFLYAYPETITDELIQVVKENDNICDYFDIPIQHISDSVLKRMGRKSTSETIWNVVRKIRKELPNVVLRTSLIVGFPGEMEEDFEELKHFVQEVKFDRLGVFEYSLEDGTPAEKLDGHMAEEIKKQRRNVIMEIQQQVSKHNNELLIGKELECKIDSITDGAYIARSYRDVPEEDGVVFVESSKQHQMGDILLARVKKAEEYDIIAEEI